MVLDILVKKIYDYAKQRFPESEESELLLTVSYYVIYKFIGSALANCADYKIVENDEDISPNTQATLAYLAKSLQFIFRFTDIEDMKLVSLNNFMKKKHSDAKKYLLALIDVQDADQHLQVNRYNKMTGTTVPSIIIGAKEIVMLHDLLNEHKEAVIPLEDDPLNIILKELGGVPEIDEEDNREVQLELVNKFEVEIKEGEEEKDFKKKTLEETLSILENISIPPGKNFMEILVRAKLFAEKEGKTGISDAIKTLLKSLKKLEDKGLIVKGDGYSSFLKELFDEVNEMKRRIEEQKKEIERLKGALQEIDDQKVYMENKIEAFEAYLGSLRRDAEERFKEKSKKFTYKELVKRHVIAETEIEEGLLKKNRIQHQTSSDR